MISNGLQFSSNLPRCKYNTDLTSVAHFWTVWESHLRVNAVVNPKYRQCKRIGHRALVYQGQSETKGNAFHPGFIPEQHFCLSDTVVFENCCSLPDFKSFPFNSLDFIYKLSCQLLCCMMLRLINLSVFICPSPPVNRSRSLHCHSSSIIDSGRN